MVILIPLFWSLEYQPPQKCSKMLNSRVNSILVSNNIIKHCHEFYSLESKTLHCIKLPKVKLLFLAKNDHFRFLSKILGLKISEKNHEILVKKGFRPK